MYTITRKLAVVCLAVVFSVLMYGCGGGGSEQASTMTPPTDTPPTDSTDMVITPPVDMTVDMSMVTAGLIVPSGTFTILPGESRDRYDATFTCPTEGSSCEVTVADDGTAMSVGGMATAMNSVPGNAKRDASNPPVDIVSDVTLGLTITPGMYDIDPGGDTGNEAGDVTFTCPIGGVPCMVTVADDGTVTSVGGAATAMNSSDGDAKRDASNPPVDIMSDVTAGLTITPGMYDIDPGGDTGNEAGDVTFTCPIGGVPCMVTVADDGTTVTSVGGAATAMNSSDGDAKRYASNPPVDISMVVDGLIIKPGMYTIQPGESSEGMFDFYDAIFTCPAEGLPCMVTVGLDKDGDTTVTSVGGMAEAMVSDSGTTKLTNSGTVDTTSGVVTAGLTEIDIPETHPYTISPGGSVDLGDVTFSCPLGGVSCTITVTRDLDADGEETGTSTVMFVGGMATAKDSPDGDDKLKEPNAKSDLAIGNLATGYSTIKAGTEIIQPGDNSGDKFGEATFECAKGGVPCKVTVKVEVNPDDEDAAITTITSLGGMATLKNSDSVVETRMALALNAAQGPLDEPEPQDATEISVTRSTDGDTTTFKLTPRETMETGYTSEAVDEGHEITTGSTQWIGKTLTRAAPVATPEKATFYTNIKPAKPQKLKYGGTGNDRRAGTRQPRRIRAGQRSS